jgi:phosphoadenosine phosphosulfate reductase
MISESLISLNHKIKNPFDLSHLFGLLDDARLGKIVFSTSLGQEDQVLTDFIFRNDLDVDVFTLDTGRLFQQTYDVLSATTKKYKKKIKCYYPNQQDLTQLVDNDGINGFYDSIDKRKSCCGIRKIEPLNRALRGADVWITGLRQDQSANRADLDAFEYDAKFDIIKFNPLSKWSLHQVNEYLETYKVPQNKLHAQGFASIGCAPCTRAISPGEDIRAGRWWWETSHKECGLHQINN